MDRARKDPQLAGSGISAQSVDQEPETQEVIGRESLEGIPLNPDQLWEICWFLTLFEQISPHKLRSRKQPLHLQFTTQIISTMS